MCTVSDGDTGVLALLTFVGCASLGWVGKVVVELGAAGAVYSATLLSPAPGSANASVAPISVRRHQSREKLQNIGTPPPNVTLPPWAQLFIDGRPFPPFDNRTEAPRKRGCIANDAFGEGCYFSDAMICVGFGDRLKVGMVGADGDPAVSTDRGRVKRGGGGAG